MIGVFPQGHLWFRRETAHPQMAVALRFAELENTARLNFETRDRQLLSEGSRLNRYPSPYRRSDLPRVRPSPFSCVRDWRQAAHQARNLARRFDLFGSRPISSARAVKNREPNPCISNSGPLWRPLPSACLPAVKHLSNRERLVRAQVRAQLCLQAVTSPPAPCWALRATWPTVNTSTGQSASNLLNLPAATPETTAEAVRVMYPGGFRRLIIARRPTPAGKGNGTCSRKY